jgi:hypothetical protein
MTATPSLVAPFPWFGGKSRAAPAVWSALGDCAVYVEPFAGSLAAVLGRPIEDPARYVETVNDADGFVCNVWRAIASDPEAVAAAADWPVNEADLHARHLWLVGRRAELTQRLMGDPEYFDAKVAGWWLWGICAWIGSGWCSGRGPWVRDEEGRMVKGGGGVERKRPRIGGDGAGVHKAAVRDAVSRHVPHLHSDGQGIHKPTMRAGVSRQVPLLSHEVGVLAPGRTSSLGEWFTALQVRLRHVRVCCGDWARILGPSSTWKHLRIMGGRGACGVFLDPPYRTDVRAGDLYSVGDDGTRDLAAECRAWALENQDRPNLRIVLAGYEGEGHEELTTAGWRAVEWFAGGFLRGGYGNQSDEGHRQHRERLWLSPQCLDATKPARPQLDMFTTP